MGMGCRGSKDPGGGWVGMGVQEQWGLGVCVYRGD